MGVFVEVLVLVGVFVEVLVRVGVLVIVGVVVFVGVLLAVGVGGGVNWKNPFCDPRFSLSAGTVAKATNAAAKVIRTSADGRVRVVSRFISIPLRRAVFVVFWD